jgi:cell division protein FtsX
MDTPIRQKILISSVIITILVLASLVSASMNVSKFRKGFRDEMAQRLDLEEKISRMEKEHQALISEIDSLKNQALKDKDEAALLRDEVSKERKDAASLREALEKAESLLKGTMQ